MYCKSLELVYVQGGVVKMKWHKSYQKQGVECRKSGNSFVVEVPDARGFYVFVPACAVIVCIPFKTYCHSKACREMRLRPYSENCMEDNL